MKTTTKPDWRERCEAMDIQLQETQNFLNDFLKDDPTPANNAPILWLTIYTIMSTAMGLAIGFLVWG